MKLIDFSDQKNYIINYGEFSTHSITYLEKSKQLKKCKLTKTKFGNEWDKITPTRIKRLEHAPGLFLQLKKQPNTIMYNDYDDEEEDLYYVSQIFLICIALFQKRKVQKIDLESYLIAFNTFKKQTKSHLDNQSLRILCKEKRLYTWTNYGKFICNKQWSFDIQDYSDSEENKSINNHIKQFYQRKQIKKIKNSYDNLILQNPNISTNTIESNKNQRSRSKSTDNNNLNNTYNRSKSRSKERYNELNRNRKSSPSRSRSRNNTYKTINSKNPTKFKVLSNNNSDTNLLKLKQGNKINHVIFNNWKVDWTKQGEKFERRNACQIGSEIKSKAMIKQFPNNNQRKRMINYHLHFFRDINNLRDYILAFNHKSYKEHINSSINNYLIIKEKILHLANTHNYDPELIELKLS